MAKDHPRYAKRIKKIGVTINLLLNIIINREFIYLRIILSRKDTLHMKRGEREVKKILV